MFQNYLFYFAKRHAKTSFLTLPAPFQKVINLFQRATLLRQGSAPVALRALPYVLRLLLSKSLILCKMGPLGGQNPLSWILLELRFVALRFKFLIQGIFHFAKAPHPSHFGLCPTCYAKSAFSTILSIRPYSRAC